MKRNEFTQYLAQVPDWAVINSDLAIEKDFKFKNFKLSILDKSGIVHNLFFSKFKNCKFDKF